jgi:glycosyltransferase involved in cell wall biosynthesis
MKNNPQIETKINVLLILHELNLGGTEMVYLQYLRGFDATRFKFNIVTLTDRVGELEQDFIDAGADVFHLGSPRNVLKWTAKFKKFLALQNYDIIESPASAYAAIWMREASKRNRIPVRILTAHTSQNYDILGRSRKGIQSRLQDQLRSLPSHYTTNFAAVSVDAAKYAFIKLWKNGQVKILHNPVDFEKFKFIEQPSADEGSKNNSIVLGTIGRVVYPKNHEFLLNILAQLPDRFKLVICGDGELRSEQVLLAKDLGVEHRVNFMGQISSDEIPSLLSSYDIFLLPSRFEGQPIAALEAQASGLPCIISQSVPVDLNELPDSRQAYVTKLPIEGDNAVQQWADKIRDVADSLSKLDIHDVNTTRSEAFKQMNQTGYALANSVREKEQSYFDALVSSRS